MAENTQIVIADPQPANRTLIDQPYGQAQYHVTKEPHPHFEVDSPLLATVVKGTTFTVSAGKTKNSVTVIEGRVEARNQRTGSVSAVSTGQTGSVVGNGNGVSVHAASNSANSDSANVGNGDGNNGNGNGNGGGNGSNGGGNGNGNNGNGNGNGGGNGSNGGGNGNGGNGNNGNGKGNGGN